jgi:hypothetical protein
MKCVGACETCSDGHLGVVRHVRVSGGASWPTGYDWGLFMYCEQAIDTDRSRGFVVEIWDKHEYGEYAVGVQ